MSARSLPAFAVLMAIGFAALVVLVRQERRASHPLLPISLLRQPTIWRSDVLAACHGATLVSLVTFLPIYLRVLRDASASETGLLLLPMMIGIGFGSMTTGRVMTRTGFTTIFPSVGLIFATLALVVFALFANTLGREQLMAFLFCTGLSMGTVMGVVQVTVQNAAGSASLGSAAASVQLSRSIGAGTGTAIVGTVLFASLALGSPQSAGLFRAIVEHGPGTMATIPAAQLAVLQAEIASAFRAAFLTIAGFAAAGTILAWSIPARRI
jgi:predicted MFS family arabinose efflux permease